MLLTSRRFATGSVLLIAPLLFVALLLATPAMSHHSHAMYDSTQQINLVGTVKDLQWSNPHVFLNMVVLDEAGQAQNWALEGGSPGALLQQGWPSGNPKPGDEVSVTIRPLKVGARGGLIRTVTFADGSEFTYAPDTGPTGRRGP